MKTINDTTPDQQNMEPVPPYRHPLTGQTAAWHRDGKAYTASGILIGDTAEAMTAKEEPINDNQPRKPAAQPTKKAATKEEK